MPTKQLSSPAQLLAAIEHVEDRILFIRGQKVMLASDLAELYGVTTFRLNEQVKRNLRRFPDDFMFQLTREENDVLTSQIAMSNSARGGRRYLPYAFTEQGVAMLSSVLNSDRAIEVNIAIMRAFIRLRSFLAAHKELAKKIEMVERSTVTLKKTTDANFAVVFKFIKDYLQSKKQLPSAIGFKVGRKK
jgi:hypothetical protein